MRSIAFTVCRLGLAAVQAEEHDEVYDREAKPDGPPEQSGP
jgi:hypothetical protein